MATKSSRTNKREGQGAMKSSAGVGGRDLVTCFVGKVCRDGGNRFSTGNLDNVTLTHSGVSSLVALMCRNNKSTRYAALLQFLKHQFRL